jgi:hypothetical protein
MGVLKIEDADCKYSVVLSFSPSSRLERYAKRCCYSLSLESRERESKTFYSRGWGFVEV